MSLGETVTPEKRTGMIRTSAYSALLIIATTTQLGAGGSVRGERANLKGLVNGCIEANFCNKICVGKLSPRSTQCNPLHRSRSRGIRLGSRGIRLGEKIYENKSKLNFLFENH